MTQKYRVKSVVEETDPLHSGRWFCPGVRRPGLPSLDSSSGVRGGRLAAPLPVVSCVTVAWRVVVSGPWVLGAHEGHRFYWTVTC